MTIRSVRLIALGTTQQQKLFHSREFSRSQRETSLFHKRLWTNYDLQLLKLSLFHLHHTEKRKNKEDLFLLDSTFSGKKPVKGATSETTNTRAEEREDSRGRRSNEEFD